MVSVGWRLPEGHVDYGDWFFLRKGRPSAETDVIRMRFRFCR